MVHSIGYAQTIINPSLDRPVYLAGFGQNRRATTIHDDLYVRALALIDEQSQLVLCALDLVGFFSKDAQEVIWQVRLQEPKTQVIIASTHTHHAPDTMGLWGPNTKKSGIDDAYLAEVKEKIVQTILKALQNPQPCSYYKYNNLRVPGVAKNARNPEIVDDELTTVQFLDEDKKPLVSLFNFPCHPEVLWEFNPHITPDYPGYLRATVEAVSGAPCVFFSGSLGGMMTPDVKDHTFAEAEGMGKALAVAGLSALHSTEPQSTRKAELFKEAVQLKLTNILFKWAIRRKILPELRDAQGFFSTEVNLVKMGGLWLMTVPGELLPKLGLQLKTWMKNAGAEVCGVIGLANDELGYILPPEDFRYPLNPFKPGAHYEETMSISKDAGKKIMEAARKLLADR